MLSRNAALVPQIYCHIGWTIFLPRKITIVRSRPAHNFTLRFPISPFTDS